ncbi:MAG: serine hydrolase [Phycisphaeraceae bacterium]|nr:serine hydrolase [Phycisphaerales bacterium]MCB9841748.1 serine hydrolase [Phycisphaeraceae bacterium]
MMRMRAAAVLLALVGALVLVRGAEARYTPPAVAENFVGPQTPEWMPYEPVVDLPETRAGARVAWILEMFRGGEMGAVSDYATQRVIDQVGEDGFREFIAQGREAAGWMFPTVIIESQEDALIAYLRSAADPERWVLRVTTTEDEPGKIDSLVFQPAPTPGIERARDWQTLADRLDAAGYDYSVTVWEIVDREGKNAIAPVALMNEKKSLNISGAMSLYVLGAVTEKIAAGDGSWEEMVTIRESLKSIPDSPLKQTPEGVEHMVASLAGQMLQGDDTATDHLIDWVGMDRLTKFVEGVRTDSAANGPFLTTTEAYELKMSFDPELQSAYAAADVAGRRAMLDGFDTIDAELMKFWVKPQGVDKVGHFASSRELASVLLYLRNTALRPGMEALREILGANQQFRVDSGLWRSMSFSAGAEPGVLCAGVMMERMDGRWFVVTIVFNNAETPLVPDETSPLMLALIELLQRP